MKAAVNGISINYRIDGQEGAPWITFSNSLATNLSMWDGQVERLKDRYRILRYDTRGHGGTEATPGPYGFAQLVRDVIGLWDTLGITRSHLVGLSLGGMTALGLAIHHPEHLLSIACCDARADATPDYKQGWVTRMAEVRASGIPGLVEPTVARWCHPDFLQSGSPVLDRMRAMIRTTTQEGWLGCAGALMHLDYLPELGKITVPTLFVVGGQDGVLPAAMRDMQSKVAGAQFVELSPAGHISNLEQPDGFNRALENFLAGVR